MKPTPYQIDHAQYFAEWKTILLWGGVGHAVLTALFVGLVVFVLLKWGPK